MQNNDSLALIKKINNDITILEEVKERTKNNMLYTKTKFRDVKNKINSNINYITRAGEVDDLINIQKENLKIAKLDALTCIMHVTPKSSRDALAMRYIDLMCIKDIAAQLNTSTRQVTRLIDKGLRQLK